jgi:hypothetical protein
MEMLAAWLAEARKSGLNRAFITFHNPAFATTGAGAIPADQNPHRLIAQFAADLDIIVFNGHVHTTELFEKDGVRYLLLGNGGGEQDYSPCEPPRNCTSRDDELYWKSENRVEEYNYLVVTVSQGGVQMKLRRYRPEAATPFETVELFR